MFYPEDFKKRVKEAYPNFEQLHCDLDNGEDEAVGKFLDKRSDLLSISIYIILDATSLEELQKMARENQKKLKLYGEWCELYDAQEPKNEEKEEEGVRQCRYSYYWL